MKNNFVAKFMNRFNRASVEQDNRQDLLDKIELLEAEALHIQMLEEGIREADVGNLTDIEAVRAKWMNRVNQHIEHLSGQELADELYKSKERNNEDW